MAVFWDPAKPDTIFDQAFFDRALPNAMRRGIEVIFAIYPERARSLVDTPNGVELFAQYAARVVQRYPYVRKVICLNEGNQPASTSPSSTIGRASPAMSRSGDGRLLRRGRAVDLKITVIAFGLTARQRRLRSFEQRLALTDPLLEEVGEAYRASDDEADRGRGVNPAIPT